MKKYIVRVPVYADYIVEVRAESENKAIEIALEKGIHGLCHQCSNNVELGDQDLSADVTAEEIDG